MVKAVVLDVDVEKERILAQASSSSKATPSPSRATVKKGAVVTCEVLESEGSRHRGEDLGQPTFTTSSKRSGACRDRNDQRAERFAVGEKSMPA